MRPPSDRPSPRNPTRRLAVAVALLLGMGGTGGIAGGIAGAASPGAKPRPPREGERWPLWPSEVTQQGDLLVPRPEDSSDDPVAESPRQAALSSLEAYATPLVEPYLVAALDHPSPSIRRDALQACHRRQLRSCIPAARGFADDPLSELSIRLYALRVLLLDPTPENLGRVLGALRDPNELLRVEAARLLALTPLPQRETAEVKAALLAKLSDPGPEARRAIASALGLLGATEATLVLARMLDDPDPQLRRDAAEALGIIDDPRALPALLRALDRGDEPHVARALLDGLLRQPGEAIDRALLGHLDAPPRGLTPKQIASALGDRQGPSPLLLEGILLRLHEPGLRNDLLGALLHLGEAAIPALEAALARGVEPELAIELQRLLAARRLPTRPLAPALEVPIPGAEARAAWHARLGRRHRDRLVAAATLGALDPPWLAAAIAGALRRGDDPAADRPWLVALATAATAPATGDLLLWADVARRAGDRRRARGDRCLAIAALGRAPPRLQRSLGDPLHRLSGAPEAVIRGCVALALTATLGATDHLRTLLDDPSPRVRAAAAFALAATPARPPAALAPHLAWRATSDRDGRVRSAAAAAREPIDPPGALHLLHGRDAPAPAGSHEGGWIAAEIAGRRLWIPGFRLEGELWALVGDRRLRGVLDEPLSVTAEPDGEDEGVLSEADGDLFFHPP